jgi:hypothetical protein
VALDSAAAMNSRRCTSALITSLGPCLPDSTTSSRYFAKHDLGMTEALQAALGQ